MIDRLVSRPGSTTSEGLDGLARWLLARGLTPNALSGAALALGLLGATLIALDRPWWGLLVLAGSGIGDAVDGRAARLGGGATVWGGVLDLIGDRIVEAAVLLAIAWPRPEWHLPALVLALTWYVNITVFLVVGAACERRSEKLIAYPPGILERSEALVFAAFAIALPSLAPDAAYLYALLGLVTAAQRFAWGRRALR